MQTTVTVSCFMSWDISLVYRTGISQFTMSKVLCTTVNLAFVRVVSNRDEALLYLIWYYNASCHLFDIAPLRGAVALDIPFSIDISPLRGGRNVKKLY